MDELFQSVGTLRKRIEMHAPSLRANEALTRYALINPLLIGLGWDISDPAQVVPEFTVPSNQKRADYALFRPGNRVPYIIIEAKKLGEGLSEAAHQAVTYCTVDGYEYFAVTDGQVWELYRTRSFGELSKKRVTKFDLLEDSPISVCLKALAFWRSAVSAGAIGEGRAPILGTGSAAEGEGSFSTKEPPKVSTDDGGTPPPIDSVQASSQVWIRLPDLKPKAGEKPRELRLPSGEIVPTTSGWKSLMVESVRWLLRSGKLPGAGNPIQSGTRYIVAPTPNHPNGKPFTAPRQVGQVFVETNHGGNSAVRLTLKVIADVGESAANFGVRMQP